MPKLSLVIYFAWYARLAVAVPPHASSWYERPSPGSLGSSIGPTTTQQQMAIGIVQSLKSGSRNALKAIDENNFVQHNLNVGEKVPGYIELQGFMSTDPTTVTNPIRVFQDGEFVILHMDYSPSAGMDVYRFQDGKIVEHWDNIQEMPTKPNGAGHTMLDGPTRAKDLDKTEVNKALVKNFVTDVFLNKNTLSAFKYVNTERYIQHNPNAQADGIQGTLAIINSLPPGTNLCSRIRHILGQGDFVLTMCDGTFANNATAFYDLYRVENGKISEHWDVIEQIPPCSDWKNMNGKF